MSPLRAALGLAAALAALLGLAGGGARAATPFYLVPSPTRECQGVGHCVAVAGPWVVVPASGEATYLMECQTRRGYLIGGTDARATSPDIRVWFDGELGAPIGAPASSRAFGAVLLFQAHAENNRLGAFQPVLGCVSLPPASRIATVSVRVHQLLPGSQPGPPLDLRAEQLDVAHLVSQTAVERCPRRQRLVGSWSALAFQTSGPPDLGYVHAVTVRTRRSGNAVYAVIHAGPIFQQLLATVPTVLVQVGAMCQP